MKQKIWQLKDIRLPINQNLAKFVTLYFNQAKDISFSQLTYTIQASLVIRGGYVPEKFMIREYQIYYFRPTYA